MTATATGSGAIGWNEGREKLILHRFRELIKDLRLTESQRQDNAFLLRWILAREGNLENAKVMLKKSLEWRAANDIDRILLWTPPQMFSTLCPMEFLGDDANNVPVLYAPIGKWNLRQLVALGEKENFLKYADWVLEQVETGTMKTMTGSPIKVHNRLRPQVVALMDLAQLSILTLASVGVVDMLMTTTRKFEANHPEIMKTIYIINAGPVFSALLSLVRPLMSEKTIDKLVIFGTNPDTWRPTISAAIPQSILPEEYGGSNNNVNIKLWLLQKN